VIEEVQAKRSQRSTLHNFKSETSLGNYTKPDRVNFYQHVQKKQVDQRQIKMMSGSEMLKGFSRE
jgi:hypothetical protein